VEITKTHFETANKIAKKFTKNYDDQQDIVTNCTLKLWKVLTKKGFSPGKGYEYTVMYSGAIDWLRKQKKFKKIEISDIKNYLEYGKEDTKIRDAEFQIILESYKEEIQDYDLLLELLRLEEPSDVAVTRHKTPNAARVEIHRKRKNWKDVYKEINPPD
jgi:DNA-directed RNA polymerase specialized sigma24 family protein